MQKRKMLSTILCTVLAIGVMAQAGRSKTMKADPLDRYNVVWRKPSRDSSGSMPIGNGDIGLNVWVEEGGDLLFYISKTDAWSENVRLLKLGRVRVKLSPNPFSKGLPFRQTLKLRQGEIGIRAGNEDSEITTSVFVDANHPVICVEAQGRRQFDIRVSLEVWRKEKRTLHEKELFSAYGMNEGPHPVVVYSDTILDEKSGRIVWFHRNEESAYPLTMKLQGLASLLTRFPDPLLNRTFGGAIKGAGLVKEDATTLKSAQPGRRHIVSIYPLTSQTATDDEWLRQLDRVIAQSEATDFEQARKAHRRWWNEFWNRSWIRVSRTNSVSKDETANAFRVSQGYALQRFIAACGGRGAFPIKFNGSIFTVDSREAGEKYDADYRRWGGPYWFQNTRLPYWPMLASGDFDLMEPLFRMYGNALPLAEARTGLYFGHRGAFFPETMYFWGAYANNNYGWNRKGKPSSHVDNTYIRYYWSSGLELTTMMLDYYFYTGDKDFLKSSLLPFGEAIVHFYDTHYARDDKGKLLLKPAQSLETWQKAVNPLPPIAGLRFALSGLLSLPPDLTGEERRASWRRLLGHLPSLPAKEEAGRRFLLPAQEFGQLRNSENPELYAIFPYRLFGVGKPSLQTGRLTFQKRRVKRTGGWTQDAIQTAYLGLADVAASYTATNFSNHHGGSRFPAFWGPNFDWVPDQDHGSVALMALQTMLMQSEGEKIFLFPAWPKKWDVEFKLHAPMSTTVEGAYRNGELKRLRVTPQSRAKDVVKMNPQ